ncbi:MAG: hypothetical protein V7K47_13375 [Nostoc sp.]
MKRWGVWGVWGEREARFLPHPPTPAFLPHPPTLPTLPVYPMPNVLLRLLLE